MKSKTKFKVGDRVKATEAYFAQPFNVKELRGLRGTINTIGLAFWVKFPSKPGLYIFRNELYLRKVT